MKKLTAILAATSVMMSSYAFAGDTANVEQVTAALVKQQNASVSQAVSNQVNQDINFALRAMKMPKVDLAKGMLAKAETTKAKDSE